MKTEIEKNEEKIARRRRYIESITVEEKKSYKDKELKKENFVRLRINEIEKERLLKIEKLTGRKKSDILREAMFRFVKSEYPEFL
jgi:hypothetical protein